MSTTQHVLDHRRVQTAVIGHKNSDHPVILPMDAHELDLWRKAHPTYSYWCGHQLGGCGAELSDRRYTEKVCHFAHHPSAPVCHRAANGESSADHLFIKRGMQRLLSKQHIRGDIQTRDLGTGPGDAVDVYLPHTSRIIRFQLTHCDYPAWRRHTDALRPKAPGGVDWVFRSDVPATRELLDCDAYFLRVRLETVGGERHVHIGTEARDRSVTWTPLGDCTLTSTGLSTPRVETIRISRPRPQLPSFPLAGGLVFRPIDEARPLLDTPFAATGRRLITADVRPTDSPIVRAALSLPADSGPPSADHVYGVPDSARMLVLEDGQGWVVEVNRCLRLNTREAERTGLWTPPQGAPTAPVPAEPALVVPTPSPTKPRVLTHVDMVTEVRTALADFARLGATTTWEELASRLGVTASQLSDTERRDLLVDVDSPLSEYLPVRSALVLDGDAPLPYLGEILHRLGIPYAKTSTRLHQWAAVERERAYAAFGQPSRAMGPRLALTPARPAQKNLVKKAFRGSTTLFNRREDPRLSELLTTLRRLGPHPVKAVRQQINTAMHGASVWLGQQPTGGNRKWIEAAKQSRDHHIHELEQALIAHRTSTPTRPTGLPPTVEKMQKKGKKPSLRKLQNEFLARYEAQQKATKAELRKSIPTQLSSAPQNTTHRPVEQLTRQLIHVAAQGRTISMAELENSGITPAVLHMRLALIDRRLAADTPMLSALVTTLAGGPVPFFRTILKQLSLAVPQTDEALMAIWRREQERAHAAYANPPRELPPRLVPLSG
ncbi:hypothetical protein [Streptomyces sp. VRA16 Mangrove soil]|uniref:hypothetical protein n=1 Tax=Streptomyces sp. VRA16 Mangrove soil TaxID=2817434 RepID=UPI001A9E0645|nr:hypothetical protein [Streptomyces sp. VRA16 Mangrove soil]MBO1334066.1 hypothetical protein [Streptomyces sp. VRA16 Mangrove soil]